MFDFDRLNAMLGDGDLDSGLDNFVKEVPEDESFSHIPEVNFVKHITDGMKRYNGDRPEDGWFHPSELDGCSISIWFNKVYGRPNNKKNEFSPLGKMAVTLGHAIHEMLEGAMERSDVGIGFKSEVPLVSAIDRIKGTTDGISIVGDHKYILEFKSCKSSWYEKYKYYPDPKHVRQVHCYMHMTGIRVAYIIYFCKDDNAMTQHRVDFKKTIMQPIIDRINSIRAAVIERKIPTDLRFISCDVLNNPKKACANYKRCIDYHKKFILPEEEDCLMVLD